MSTVEENKITEPCSDNMIIQIFEGYEIRQMRDGKLCASDACKVAGKLWPDYKRNRQTEEFLKELERAIGIPMADLIVSITANVPNRGTWVHPRVAIHLAQWIGPRFAAKVTDWVLRFMTGDLTLAGKACHDELSGTASEMVIRSYDAWIRNLNKLNDDLFKQAKHLHADVKKFRECVCKYCNHHCEDKLKAVLRAVIQMDRFKTYMGLLFENVEKVKCEIDLYDWETEHPKVRISTDGIRFESYDISFNSNRWKIVNILNTYVIFPFDQLLDKESYKMIKDNQGIFTAVSDFMNDYEITLETEFQELLDAESDEE